MEMTLSMGLWVMLLGTFMASLFFGIRNMTTNYYETGEYTNISLFFENMVAIIKENEASVKKYNAIDNTLMITDKSGNTYVLYFQSNDDKELDNNYTAKDYTIRLQKLDKKNKGFTYGHGRWLLKEVAPPPLSFIKLNDGYIDFKIKNTHIGFGPFQTSISYK
ncbi:MAG: hypothetical protein KAI43_04425 [Candidatus Aureabacteria bacterium]|nr:hypothetical protein [Candidatus Auribacterota bacterium]